ncbi:MAG: TetR/AcrR family transcriptional regulator [Acinetobacter populi]|jgi:AcrR family transcriptional regulator|uniref:TetR/AcrR family transcriptional regulator n=1 Tax=Acinetobacter populi TaxID=1582270 RepID=UPI002356F92E|nr:TetR/AcrR family transcriptional regulator [Acinetobacter populi]MCH4248789.1 TetR/AcrR family transcriptional regulator [Acinetobacter populi]
MTASTSKTKTASRQFKGLTLEERKQIRREKFIDAGLQSYGTHGFFSVTIKDICHEAKLTERYFYESFKRSEELFKVVYLQLISDLQKNIVQAVMQAAPDHEQMIEAGLTVLLKTLKDDPRIARILFIDAVLVQELHGDTIYESFTRFDQTIFNIITLIFPKQLKNKSEASLIATGLNGYVTQIAMRWVVGGFKQPFAEVLSASCLAYRGILSFLNKKK